MFLTSNKCLILSKTLTAKVGLHLSNSSIKYIMGILKSLEVTNSTYSIKDSLKLSNKEEVLSLLFNESIHSSSSFFTPPVTPPLITSPKTPAAPFKAPKRAPTINLPAVTAILS